MKKSIFSKFLIVTLALTAFLVGYLFLGADIGSSPKTGTILDKFGGQTTDNNPGIENEPQIPFLITDRKAISLENSLDKNSILYYEKETGKLFEFNFDEKTEKVITDTILSNFMASVWSPTKKEAIHSFYSQYGQDYKHYSFSTGKTTPLDPSIQSLAFSPDGNAIVYYYLESSSPIDESGLPAEAPVKVGRVLIAQPDGQYQKKILDTRIQNLQLMWPAKNQIVLKTPDSGIYILTEDSKLTKFLEPLGLFQEKWSQSGKSMLFSALTEEKVEPVLRIKELETREERSLYAEGNAQRCVWSIDDINIICALMKSPSVDEIYQINTVSGSKRLLAEPGLPIKELLLSKTENYVFFVSTSDEKLYGVRIDN